MSQYILLNNIRVQNANAVAGFTWGFPAITHFLGFTHSLTRKLIGSDYRDIAFTGCAVISHKTHAHTYGRYEKQFTQSRNPPYLKSHDKKSTPPVIEEGKMNMTVSLLINYDGYLGQNSYDSFKEWLLKQCLLQRLAGGSILDIETIEIYNLIANEQDSIMKLRVLKRKLLPGFILMDRADYLEEHYQTLNAKNDQVELLDAWFDFITLKQKARPKSNLVTQYIERKTDNELIELWQNHLEDPYEVDNIPKPIKEYFSKLEKSESMAEITKKILEQWQRYCEPNDKTDADWEYVPKPKRGFLVPIMTGYKAISKVYRNNEVENTRDNETDVCFVESVHSIGEWLSVHRINNSEALSQSIWRYKPYEENWYLCTQSISQQESTSIEDDCPIN